MTHPPLRPLTGRRANRVIVLATLALAAWGCQDTTGPAVSPGGGPTPRLAQTSTHYCSTRTVTPHGVQQGWIPLSFPPEARAAGGASMEYRFRRQTPSGVLTYSADCVIPRTLPAVELMNQRFRVPQEQHGPRGRDRDGNEFTIQGCVKAGECILEPFIGVAPVCDEQWEPHCGSSGGPGTTPAPPPTNPPPAGGGGSTGGDGGAPAETNSDLPEGDLEQINCTNPGSAQEKAFCVREIVRSGTVRYQRTKDAIERIRQRGGPCADIAARASSYLDAGQVGYYAIEDGMAGGYGVRSQGIALQDRWVDTFFETPERAGRTLDWVIAHEIEHTMGQLAHSYTDTNGIDHTTNDNLCSAR